MSVFRQGHDATVKMIIIVEDDPDTGELLDLALASETGYPVHLIRSGREVLQHLDEIQAMDPVLFILDYRLLAMTALQVYDQLHMIERLKSVPTIILTADSSEEAREAIQQRHLAILEKPFELDALIALVKQFLPS